MTAHDTPQFTNRLAQESSLYLKQHAHNPVDWYPWGSEALQRAKQLNRPIFLSIGYSACHWCHVMERESFENEAIAAYLNEHFVCIKVDREERPDLDQIYMEAVVLITRQGGWPMSVFLTPEGKPFFGGTYWPPHSRPGMAGFTDILHKIQDFWINRREDCETSANQLLEAMSEHQQQSQANQPLSENLMESALEFMIRATDQQQGGFGSQPKFPHATDFLLLHRLGNRLNSQQAKQAVDLTLTRMANGGIYDHLGGGFARYATDRAWLIPHFEKMLYDNALLLPLYAEVAQSTNNNRYQEVCHEILTFLKQEMTSPSGLLYSTLDADSEGVEGKFYVWSEAEIRQQLSAEQFPVFCTAYDVTSTGNWEGSTILNRVQSDEQLAEQFELPLSQVQQLLESAKQQLFNTRSQRVPPGRDEKVLASWNGLMIWGLAKASALLNDSSFAKHAQQAMDRILEVFSRDETRLWHTATDEQPSLNAYLDDYAALGLAGYELFQVTGETKYLTHSIRWAEAIQTHFAAETGGFYYTSDDHEQLVLRRQESQDNATPSGYNLAITLFHQLGRLLSRNEWIDLSSEAMQNRADQLLDVPLGYAQALLTLEAMLHPGPELVLCPGKADSDTLRSFLLSHCPPNSIVLIANEQTEAVAELQPWREGKTAINNEPTLYVCRANVCQEPIVGEQNILSQLNFG